jgi:hypothetical protein
MKWAGGIAVGLIVIAGLAIGGWRLNWWAQNNAISHTANIHQNSHVIRSADEQQAQNLIAQVATIESQAHPSIPATEVSRLQSQKATLVTQACGLISNVAYWTIDIAAFAAANCSH